jgi:hypothetical protein
MTLSLNPILALFADSAYDVCWVVFIIFSFFKRVNKFFFIAAFILAGR